MAIILHKDKGGRPRSRETILGTKPNRKRLGGANDVMTASGVPRGYQHRWVNDTSDRIYRFLEAGWEFLTSTGVTVGDKTVDNVGDNDRGSVIKVQAYVSNNRPVDAYLMVIEDEFYEEDQKYKANRIDEQERGIYNPNVEQGQYKVNV